MAIRHYIDYPCSLFRNKVGQLSIYVFIKSALKMVSLNYIKNNYKIPVVLYNNIQSIFLEKY